MGRNSSGKVLTSPIKSCTDIPALDEKVKSMTKMILNTLHNCNVYFVQYAGTNMCEMECQNTYFRIGLSIISIMKSFGSTKCDNFVNNDFMGTDV